MNKYIRVLLIAVVSTVAVLGMTGCADGFYPGGGVAVGTYTDPYYGGYGPYYGDTVFFGGGYGYHRGYYGGHHFYGRSYRASGLGGNRGFGGRGFGGARGFNRGGGVGSGGRAGGGGVGTGHH